MTVTSETTTGKTSGLMLGALTALVVGSMIGGGIFNLPRQMAGAAAPGPLVIGWAITGVGMLMLAFVFQTLANRKPEVDGGVYGYARAGFGPFVGFTSAWGYWVSAWIGNVGYLVLLITSASTLMPEGVLTIEGSLTTGGLIAGSVVLWATTVLCLAGVREAAVVNTIVTIAKVVPLLMFLVLAVVAFKADIFTADIWGTSSQVPGADGPAPLGSTIDQIKAMMLVTVWVFIGIEGASVYSERARKRSDVGKATIVGFIGVLALLVMVNLLSYGLMTQAQLAGVADPALGSILAYHVGDWGAKLIAAGLAISVLGAFLSWTLLCAEILRLPAREFIMPRLLGKDNAKGSPTWALLLTGLCTQVVLIYASGNPNAYDTMIMLASSLILLPYLWSALYHVKLAATGESYETDSGSKSKDLAIGILASIYGLWLLYAAGLVYLLYTAIFYAVGTIFYMWARKEGKLKLLSPVELGLVVVILAAAVFALIGLGNGTLSV